jgi:polyhydroxyalkanoate synthase
VWKLTRVLKGPLRFVLAGSGHIAGVVNPPAAGKYQYWTNDEPAASLDEFVAGAIEHKGSWWPDWIQWLKG